MNLKHTMTSREIAELTGKRHDHVLRDVEKMFEEINAPNFGAVDFLDTYKDAKGETRKQYRLDRDLTMTLVTKYDTARRYAVVRRWRELEGRLASTPFARFRFDLEALVRDFVQEFGFLGNCESRRVRSVSLPDLLMACYLGGLVVVVTLTLEESRKGLSQRVKDVTLIITKFRLKSTERLPDSRRPCSVRCNWFPGEEVTVGRVLDEVFDKRNNIFVDRKISESGFRLRVAYLEVFNAVLLFDVLNLKVC